MSDLQKALLVIGGGVVAAVYAYGWWQQRLHRRKFGKAFNNNHHADALYQGTYEKPAELVKKFSVGEITHSQALLPVVEEKVAKVSEPDELCGILNERSDFVIELQLCEPSPSSVLESLWQRKFDFGKAVQVCGLTQTSKQWEQPVFESGVLYSHFKVALQLVDRGGLINSAKLADFRDLLLGIARQIKAEANVPNVQQTMHYGLQLDAFCVVVDQMVGVNLMPSGDRLLKGAMIAQSATARGMSLESDGAFHLRNAQGHSLFSLINRDTKVFKHDTLNQMSTAGLTLLLDVPRVENPALQFDRMLKFAHELAVELQVNLVDDRRVELVDAGLMRIRAKVSEVESKMREQNIPAGSTQARRLFT